MDKNHCWTALNNTKPLQFRTTPALKDSDGNTAVFMKAKEALVRRSAFSKPPPNLVEPPVTPCGLAHANITEETVAQALMTQAATKAPTPDKIKTNKNNKQKINFLILEMIWSWEKVQINKHGLPCDTVRLPPHGMEKS